MEWIVELFQSLVQEYGAGAVALAGLVGLAAFFAGVFLTIKIIEKIANYAASRNTELSSLIETQSELLDEEIARRQAIEAKIIDIYTEIDLLKMKLIRADEIRSKASMYLTRCINETTSDKCRDCLTEVHDILQEKVAV